MRALYSIVLLLSLFLTSCSSKQDNIVIYKEFKNQEWERFEYLTGDFDINKASQKYDIVMEVAVNDSYPNVYENHQTDAPLLLNLTIKNPDGNGGRSKDFKFTLKDKDGNWKADKKNGCYVFRLPIIGEMSFSDKGTYNFKVENKYPKDPLQGIKSIKIECLATNK